MCLYCKISQGPLHECCGDIVRFLQISALFDLQRDDLAPLWVADRGFRRAMDALNEGVTQLKSIEWRRELATFLPRRSLGFHLEEGIAIKVMQTYKYNSYLVNGLFFVRKLPPEFVS